jgi:hypothetical protein
MDEAFVPLSAMMRDMGTPPADLVDDEAGVHTYVTRFVLESPVELDIGVDAQGRVLIGSNPPIYDVDTSYRPAYHRIRFTAERTEVT